MITFHCLLMLSWPPALCWLAVFVPVTCVLIRRYGAAGLLAGAPLLDIIAAPTCLFYVLMPRRFDARPGVGTTVLQAMFETLRDNYAWVGAAIYVVGVVAVFLLLT